MMPIQIEVELIAMVTRWRDLAKRQANQAQYTSDLRQRIGLQTNVTSLTLCADEVKRLIKRSQS